MGQQSPRPHKAAGSHPWHPAALGGQALLGEPGEQGKAKNRQDAREVPLEEHGPELIGGQQRQDGPQPAGPGPPHVRQERIHQRRVGSQGEDNEQLVGECWISRKIDQRRKHQGGQRGVKGPEWVAEIPVGHPGGGHVGAQPVQPHLPGEVLGFEQVSPGVGPTRIAWGRRPDQNHQQGQG